jgi:hypothetical protein
MEELYKINSYLFQKYNELVNDPRNCFKLIHDNNKDSIDILKLILKYNNDDLYKLYEVFSKSSYKYNLSKKEYYDKYISPIINNIYYKKVIRKNLRFIIEILDIIEF